MLFEAQPRAERLVRVAFADPYGQDHRRDLWHIRPDVIPNWTRSPMIAHSQVGYAPGFSKVAVIELDPSTTARKRPKCCA